MNHYLDSSLESAQLDCPECQMPVRYFDVQGSSFYVCPHCHTYFEYEGERRPKIIGKYDSLVPADARLLPIGTQGTLRGRECRVVGITQRREVKYPADWVEFQLFFPDKKDYQQLALFEGHWMLVRPAGRSYKASSNGEQVEAEEGVFELFNKYQSQVLWAAGEFDWDIQNDRKLHVAEFIKPPLMLVREQSDWYRAEYLDGREVAKAFELLPGVLPRREGVGAIEPNPVGHWHSLRLLTVAALALLLALQLGKSIVKPSQHIFFQKFSTPIDSSTAGTGRVLVSQPFELKADAALQIDLTTTLDNQWLELPVSLVNETTGRGFEFTKTIEYYHGYEDGESWSEGSFDADAVLANVPAGRYHFNLYPVSGGNTGIATLPPEAEAFVAATLGTGTAGLAASPLYINIAVTENPSLWSNFWVSAALLLMFPLVQWFRRSRFEANRWEDSDFADE